MPVISLCLHHLNGQGCRYSYIQLGLNTDVIADPGMRSYRHSYFHRFRVKGSHAISLLLPQLSGVVLLLGEAACLAVCMNMQSRLAE